MTRQEILSYLFNFKEALNTLNIAISQKKAESDQIYLMGVIGWFESTYDAYNELMKAYSTYSTINLHCYPHKADDPLGIFSMISDKAVSVKILADNKQLASTRQKDSLIPLYNRIKLYFAVFFNRVCVVTSAIIEVPYKLEKAISEENNRDIQTIIEQYQIDRTHFSNPLAHYEWDTFLLNPLKLALFKQAVDALDILMTLGNLQPNQIFKIISTEPNYYSENFIRKLFQTAYMKNEKISWVLQGQLNQYLFEFMQKENPPFIFISALFKFITKHRAQNKQDFSAIEFAVELDHNRPDGDQTIIEILHPHVKEAFYGNANQKDVDDVYNKEELFLFRKAAFRAILKNDFRLVAILFSKLGLINSVNTADLIKFSGATVIPSDNTEEFQYKLFNKLAFNALDEKGEIKHDLLAPLFDILSQLTETDCFFSACSVFHKALHYQLISLQEYLLKKYCTLMTGFGEKLIALQKNIFLNHASLEITLFTKFFAIYDGVQIENLPNAYFHFRHFYARINSITRENPRLTSTEMNALKLHLEKYKKAFIFPDMFIQTPEFRSIFIEKIIITIFDTALSLDGVHADESCYKQIMYGMLPPTRTGFLCSQSDTLCLKKALLTAIDIKLGWHKNYAPTDAEAWVTALVALKNAIFSIDNLTQDSLQQIILHWQNQESIDAKKTNNQIIREMDTLAEQRWRIVALVLPPAKLEDFINTLSASCFLNEHSEAQMRSQVLPLMYRT
ncbi:MAG: hypothetical protein A3E82_08300 [Gammaproteobacteria bacterium RIFCSPHIGHO2_12_FULL_38_11]|nr:MAG: hypothetical protein A3E82_08300 [Gammaproteobacteria bacterium RIFCSPHIGHO2_12_FULL_38_11]